MPKHSYSDQKHARYYEAIIQLRPAEQAITAFVHNYILQKEHVFISKEEYLKTGVDIYISSRKVAMALGRQLKRRFPGKLTLSRKIHTRDRQTSKDMYRVTILFRLEHEVL